MRCRPTSPLDLKPSRESIIMINRILGFFQYYSIITLLIDLVGVIGFILI